MVRISNNNKWSMNPAPSRPACRQPGRPQSEGRLSAPPLTFARSMPQARPLSPPATLSPATDGRAHRCPPERRKLPPDATRPQRRSPGRRQFPGAASRRASRADRRAPRAGGRAARWLARAAPPAGRAWRRCGRGARPRRESESRPAGQQRDTLCSDFARRVGGGGVHCAAIRAFN